MSVDTVKNREWIADQLATDPVVEWDRFVVGEVDGQQRVTVYGWIDREDDHEDFVLVHFWPATEHIDYTTSSDEWTEYLFHDWFDADPDDHNDCRRVEDAFDVENAIRLHDQARLGMEGSDA